ncbi:hypothetical protein R6Q59_031386 [Mikania micrantha]|uniref:H15 domain-containing protein n=1 Tax=Mikania micrantha TaxID=192012 RepID=A0A5N6NX22_9ASTR|nr:hypothetical protein E3N88_15537 [Mikania micrantha]
MATEESIVPTEATTGAVPASEKMKKVKKAPVKGRPRSPSLHPPYFEMIKEAIVSLKERTGSSQYAIAKFIEEKQKNLPTNFKKVLSIQLKKSLAAGKLVKVKASYKLPAAGSPAASALAKKKPAAKPKPVKKTTPAKKKTVTKPKPALKAKVAAKPKTVGKANKPIAKPKAVAAKAKPKAKATVKAAKIAKTLTKSTPGKKAAAAKKKPAVKSLKPMAKKATGTKKVKK